MRNRQLLERLSSTGYHVIQVPPTIQSRIIADIKHWYSQKEVKLKFKKVGKGKQSNNADIVLDTIQ